MTATTWLLAASIVINVLLAVRLETEITVNKINRLINEHTTCTWKKES